MKVSARAATASLVASLVAATAAAAPSEAPLAAAPTAHFQILDTMFQGDCGEVTPIVNTLRGNPSIDFIFPDLTVQADDSDSHARKVCNVRLHVAMDPGYKIGLGEVFFQGKATIDHRGSGNVSARAFFIGLPGVDGFRRFDQGFSDNFQVDTDAGSPNFTACGGDTYMNLLVDLTARSRQNPTVVTEVSVHRGEVTPEFAGRQADVRCGIAQSRCR